MCLLLFRKEFVPLICEGKKTQTRRLHPPRFKIGKVYPCRTQIRKESTFALAKITGIRPQRLSEISDEEAKAEGMDSRERFLEKFREIYKLSPTENPLVWVVEFEAQPAEPYMTSRAKSPTL